MGGYRRHTGNTSVTIIMESIRCNNSSQRTIKALWKAISLNTEFKVRIAEEQSQNNTLQSEDNGIFVGAEDAESLQMSEVYSSVISANMASLMEVFKGGSLEMKVMEKVVCLKYSSTQWESDKPDEYQGQIHYKFSNKLPPVEGEVTGTQLKYPMANKKGWVIEEMMELQGVLGDFFTVELSSSSPKKKTTER